MTTPDDARAFAADRRLLETLQLMLAIQEPGLGAALSRACTLVAEALRADKVDVFLYEADSEALVALGTSDTPMGHRQHQIGMNRQPIANGGLAVRTFLSGEPYRSGRADQDPEQLRGMIEGLEVRSEMDTPLEVNGERRGILQAASGEPDFFAESDLQFFRAVAGWIGMVTHRSELFEQATRDAARRGRREAAEDVAKITRRQQEVVAVIAAGLSNAEIAQRLVLTEGTVANHVEAILRRLGLRSRTQIGVWAVEHGLYRSDQEQDEGDELGERGSWGGRSIPGQPKDASDDAGSPRP